MSEVNQEHELTEMGEAVSEENESVDVNESNTSFEQETENQDKNENKPVDAVAITPENERSEDEITDNNSSVNPNPKKGKKGWIAGLAALIIAGSGYYAYDQAKRNEAHQEALDKIELFVVKETLDYADSDPVNTLTLIKATGNVTADVDGIDVRKVGNTKVVYTVEVLDSYGTAASKTFEHEFEVVDKVAPVIDLSKEEVSIYVGDKFSESDYISSVKDPVDGDLVFADSEEERPTDKGWYSITSDVAADTPGNYTVKVHAEDINGNKTDKEFSVTVSKRPVVATAPTNKKKTSTNAVTYDYSAYSGGGDSYYSGGNNYVASAPAASAPSTQEENYTAPSAPVIDTSIPSGTFPSYAEARTWANAQLDADIEAWYAGTLSNPRLGYYADAYYTEAGIEYWVVTFYY